MSAAAVAPATTRTSSSAPTSSSSPSSSSSSASAMVGSSETQQISHGEDNGGVVKGSIGGYENDTSSGIAQNSISSAVSLSQPEKKVEVIGTANCSQTVVDLPSQQSNTDGHANLNINDHMDVSCAATAVTKTSGTKSNTTRISSSSAPLPADLRRILLQVAKTGSCSWLSWNPNKGTSNLMQQQHMQLQQQQHQQHLNPNPVVFSTSPSPTSAQSTTGSTVTGAAKSIPAATASTTGTVAATAAVAAAASNSSRSSSTSSFAGRRHFSSHRLANSTNAATSSNNAAATATSGSAAPVAAAPPPRKKHRNGLHPRRRYDSSKSASSANTSGRKRPLIIRTNVFSSSGNAAGGAGTGAGSPAGAAAGTGTGSSGVGIGGASSAGSGGGCSTSASGRTTSLTSGSEPDDSTQYECDSEGTSATTNSELSVERSSVHIRYRHVNSLGTPTNLSMKMGTTNNSEDDTTNYPYRCLKDAFRNALSLVLDHWYRNQGGYKLSPAERRRHHALVVCSDQGKDDNVVEQEGNKPKITEEDIFLQRRQRLLSMLGPSDKALTGGSKLVLENVDDGPPFTIQRIAEVLIAPERYYTQTHKLCNCLEKLLLVTSSTSAFGGSTGGVTSQSRREERELAALADEKGRLESEFRQRALKRRASSLSDDNPLDSGCADPSRGGCITPNDVIYGQDGDKKSSPEGKKSDNDEDPTNTGSSPGATEAETSREMLEAAARSLRSKFDHVGIDPHHHPHHHHHSSGAVNHRDPRSIAENRSMTNSPPPPSLAMAAAAGNIPLPGGGISGFVRQHLPPAAASSATENSTDHPSMPRVPSPILFNSNHESATAIDANANMHMLHMHHAAAMAGVNMSGATTTASATSSSTAPQTNSASAATTTTTTTTTTPFDVVIDAAAGTGGTNSASNLPGNAEGADLEGRSSASNSDVDSESDDVSFDDSASDRSDGSDSGHYEPFTAARAMALNRMQQQQRLQSRVLTSLHTMVEGSSGSGFGTMGGASGNSSIGMSGSGGLGNINIAAAAAAGFRLSLPADSEYQSGDSIDSTRGEDSGGSDSSSSDMNE